MNFAVPADHGVKMKGSEKKGKYEKKPLKTVEYENGGGINRKWSVWHSHQRIGTGTGEFGNKRMSRDYPKNSIVDIDQNTEKSPGNFRSLSVTQIPVKNH